MNPIDKLTEYFKEFPGIGPRQAKRFAYFIIRKNRQFTTELADTIKNIKLNTKSCQNCFRYFTGTNHLCNICLDNKRDNSKLMIVSSDFDLESIEKSGVYEGYYFVLGGILPILEKEPQKMIRLQELKSYINKKINPENNENSSNAKLEEIILALNINPDAENTSEFLVKELQEFNLKISTLGRGLSTGSEIEYADKDTIKNALEHRV